MAEHYIFIFNRVYRTAIKTLSKILLPTYNTGETDGKISGMHYQAFSKNGIGIARRPLYVCGVRPQDRQENGNTSPRVRQSDDSRQRSEKRKRHCEAVCAPSRQERQLLRKNV